MKSRTLGYVLFEDEELTKQYITQTITTLRPGYRLLAESGSISNIEEILAVNHPDFIISGLKLSDWMSHHEYRRLNCNIPTVVYTAYPQLMPELCGLNVVHFATKPIPRSDVEESLRRVEASV